MMDEGRSTVSLENSVVATFGSDSTEALAALGGRGLEALILSGPGDKEKLATFQKGLGGAINRAAAAFGDELRVFEELENELDRGNQVLIVETEPEAAEEVSAVMRRLGARSVWDFRKWTFTQTGED
jgi:hypothetical protein